MKIRSIDVLQADAGYRVASYLKVSTDEGLVGWSEFYDGFSGVSLAPVIQGFGKAAIGMDPRHYARISETLLGTTRLAPGGLSHQAIAAIENACLDLAGKAAGLPVHTLLGGPFRERVPVYWTHCGSYRARHPDFYERVLGLPPVRTLDDLAAIAREAVQQGYRAIKTNPVFFDAPKPYMFNGGFRIEPGFLDRQIGDAHLAALFDQLAAMREAIGPHTGLMLDVSFSQRTEGYLRIARRMEPLKLYWLELDTPDAEALALIRRSTSTPIASLESLHGPRAYRPFLQQQAVDVAIVDPLWNGVWQSLRVATLADVHEVHIAPHNPVGELGNLMSAHFCAAVPNLRIMELRVDEAPWTRDFVTRPGRIEAGSLCVPDAPGWGADVNEEALAAHPVRPKG